MKKVDEYKNGIKILGDDYSFEEIEKWYLDEAQGYAQIVPEDHKDNFDEYEKLTYKYLYKYISGMTFDKALVYGGGYGTEIIPIINQIHDVTILEPGDKFKTDYVAGKKVTYITPTVRGDMSFENNSFNLITCLGVLHHVPNVSYILSEFYRVLDNNGICLIREPITSMRIFDENRIGMTKRERGLPLEPFRKAIEVAGFKIEREFVHGFGPLTKLNPSIQYSTPVMWLDNLLCKLFSNNYTYNEYSFFKKFRPTTVSYVLKK